ncbi:hypothetical protein [Paenibacillus lignilyticus]|uniref:Uncharacterized protein n=1 Tax=Paenibacillus lignilyticus TaxID=1172615 RepID=A0ABS5CDX7_9BACL|nr:hypothetical protein [Paenibacillus lignilyticus]MBP3964146.1 hypothetical protein [Paenibacillus lignilyticus]
MTFALTDWMLYSMWAVLGFMGLNFLMDMFKMMKSGTFSTDFVLGYLKDMVYYVLPLFMFANMQSLDHWGWMMLTAYYVGAFGVVFKYLMDLKGKM